MTSIRDALERLQVADDGADVVEQGGHWVTWGRLRSLAAVVDRELTSMGCEAGGRVAVVLGNRVESVAALIAIFGSERTLVTISPLQPPARLSADLAASKADFVLAPGALWSETAFTEAIDEIGAASWSVDGDAVTLRSSSTAEPQHGDGSIAVEMLTSGTTGPPKRIPLTRKQIESSLASALQHNDRTERREKSPFTGGVGMVLLPIVHIGGLWSLLASLVAARPFVMLERFTVPGWHAAVKKYQPILTALPPAAIRAVLDSDIPQADLASVRAVNAGTAAVEPALVDAFLERYGIPILVVYGATEFSGAVAGWSLKDFRTHWTTKRGSVGRAFPGVRLQVVDEDENVLNPGRSGRLQVASAQAGTSSDRWVTTSDLATLDADGYLYIDGRADDVIVRGGFKIAPETVVRALRTHAAVADAAVAGLPDPRLGQCPYAAVELRLGVTVTPEELREHCRTTLTPYEVPVAVFIVDELPRGAALKVDRRRMIAQLEELTGTATSERDRCTT